MVDLIPLRQLADDTIAVIVNDTPLQFRNRFNTADGSWHVDIFTEAGETIVLGLKLLPRINLTGRYVDDRLPPNGDFYGIDLGLRGQRPDFNSLGTDIQLGFVLDSELTTT